MKNRQRTRSGDLIFNPKRTLCEKSDPVQSDEKRTALSRAVTYTGNPAHKRNPGDFELDPPAAPRQNATLCDEANLFRKADAIMLLREGAFKGLIDKRSRNGFPLLIWSTKEIDGKTIVFEAELENNELGQYHGYPMPLSDPFRQVIIDRVQGDE